MYYSLEKMHEPKPCGERQNGKTVDAVVDAIGKLMVTEDTVIPFVVKWEIRRSHIAQVFRSLCRDHFKVKPIMGRLEFGIEGYSSRIMVMSEDHWNDYASRLHSKSCIEPTYDLD